MKTNHIIFILLILILSQLTFTLTQEQSEELPLEDYTSGDWKALDSTTKNKVWDKAPDQKKISFLKKVYPDLDLNGFNHDSLTWQKQNALGNEKTYVDFDNLPIGADSIEFDGKAFTYKFKFSEKTITTEIGSIKGLNKLVLEGYDDVYLLLDENDATFRITEEGIFYKGGSVRHGNIANGIYFSQNDLSKESLVSMETTNHYKTRNSEVLINEAIIQTQNKLTDIFFDTKNHIEQSEQFAQIASSQALMIGEDISIELREDFKKVSAKGNNLKLLNGEMQVQFDGDKTFLAREDGEAEYSVDGIFNGDDPDNPGRHFVIERTPEGKLYFGDKQRLTTVGEVYVNAAGKISDEGAKVLSGVAKVGKVDLSKIPEGLSPEEYLEALRNSDYKSLEATTTIDITDYLLNKAVAQAGRDLIDGDSSKDNNLLDMIKKGNDLLAEAGFVEELSQEDYDKLVDETIVNAAKAALEAFNEASSALPQENRDTSANGISQITNSIANLRLLQNDIPNRNSELSRTAASAFKYGKVVEGLTDTLTTLHDQYAGKKPGFIPKGTKINVELQGDRAFLIVDGPKRLIFSETGERKTVNPDPVRLSISPETAKDLIDDFYNIPGINKRLLEERNNNNN